MGKKNWMGKLACLVLISFITVSIGCEMPWDKANSTTGTGNSTLFPDSKLESAIRNAINKPSGEIYKSDLEVIVELTAENSGIANLSGINYCVNLRTLKLYGNRISDITPLTNIASLEYIDLSKNMINNISPLANASFANLNELKFSYNQIKDISVLANVNFPKLRVLFIDDNIIDNISVLANFTSLKNLRLGSNNINNVSALATLTSIEDLWLRYNQITDISSLASMTKLKSLEIEGNLISNISVLANFSYLEYLEAWDNQIKDISALANLVNLKTIYFGRSPHGGNQISDIAVLGTLHTNGGLQSGSYINIESNNINLLSGTANRNVINTLANGGANIIYKEGNTTD